VRRPEAALQIERFCAEIAAIWAKPCATPNDLLVRTAIAVNWNAPLPSAGVYPVIWVLL
jgi:hypothetical protein